MAKTPFCVGTSLIVALEGEDISEDREKSVEFVEGGVLRGADADVTLYVFGRTGDGAEDG